jgi:hypothetical protein
VRRKANRFGPIRHHPKEQAVAVRNILIVSVRFCSLNDSVAEVCHPPPLSDIFVLPFISLFRPVFCQSRVATPLIYNDFRFPLLIDRQQNTAHLASPCEREINRKVFVRHLREVVSEVPIPWTFNKSALLDMLREAK